MSSFTSPLLVSPLPDGKNWRLERPFTYHFGSRHSRTCVKVPRYFITDFASIPQPLIAVIGLTALFAGDNFSIPWLTIFGVIAILAAALLPDWGKWGKAAVVHDYLYHTGERTRKEADQIFREAMCVLDVPKWQCSIMYYCVRIFGWLAWKPSKKEKESNV